MEVIIIISLSVIINHIMKIRKEKDTLNQHECEAQLKQGENVLETDDVWTKPLLNRIDEKEKGSQSLKSSTTDIYASSSDSYSLTSFNSDYSNYTNIHEDEEQQRETEEVVMTGAASLEEPGKVPRTEDVEGQTLKTGNSRNKYSNTIQKKLEEYICDADEIQKKLEEYMEDAGDTENLFTSVTQVPDVQGAHPALHTDKCEQEDDVDEDSPDDAINGRKSQTNCYGQLFKFNISQMPVAYIGRHLLSKFRKYNIL